MMCMVQDQSCMLTQLRINCCRCSLPLECYALVSHNTAVIATDVFQFTHIHFQYVVSLLWVFVCFCFVDSAVSKLQNKTQLDTRLLKNLLAAVLPHSFCITTFTGQRCCSYERHRKKTQPHFQSSLFWCFVVKNNNTKLCLFLILLPIISWQPEVQDP